MSHDALWDGPCITADKLPQSDNTHGLYALTVNSAYFEHYRHQAAVWGTVALSGIVVEGEMGYRAERATVRSLEVRRHPSEMKDVILLEITCALEDRYQCPVTVDSDAIWQAIPDGELSVFPGQIFYSATTQVYWPQYSSAQTSYLPAGSLAGYRRR